ncbi:F-box/kelch-repeat protein At1g15670-like [Zingiber officinale]|uniref:F-box/kelch-repeat protein n=1 Tax=Zingiber officinale TaxID=94328 RepID=A0A8J5KRE9_ZINOF|nr:F-box/kelch-repeat protein At1g15670-like [Zingiber officinale]KAG6486260.1 hypothetical protein ZIOFF_054830 [Zingiber officinale]
MEAALIPGLPADIALEGLLRLPFHAFAGARCDCKRWREEITSPSFYRLRKASGHARPLVALVAAVGHELVVIGVGRPPTGTVHVYNLLTGVRRRGATMPRPLRATFAFATSAVARMAYVAGGENVHGMPLRSALAYDVAADAWVRLPDMERPRKECRGIFVNGAFCVRGGQGLFDWTSEAFDVEAGRWIAKQGKLLEKALIGPWIGVAAYEGRVYRCDYWKGGVDVCSDNGGEGGWRSLGVVSKKVHELPIPVFLDVAAWNGGVMVVRKFYGGQTASILEEGKWKEVVLPRKMALSWKVKLPWKFSAYVQTLCSFQL